MDTDKLRLILTYGLAYIIVVGAGYLIFRAAIPSEQLLPFLTFAVGGVIGFIFPRESGAGASRATERAITLGATTATPNEGPGAPPSS